MFKLIAIAALSTLAFGQVSKADTQSQYLQIKSMSVQEIPVDQNLLMKVRSEINPYDIQSSLDARGDGNPLDVVDPVRAANDVLDGIINFGSKVWKIFEKSTPVVNLNMQRANALPAQLREWTEMDNWSDVEAKQYAVTYKNGFNADVVTFKVLLTYAYNGQYNGTGRYLNQVGFLANEYNVAPLFTLNAQSEVVRVQNVGTRAAPIAGLELNLTYQVENVLTKRQSALNYYLRGDGALKLRQALK